MCIETINFSKPLKNVFIKILLLQSIRDIAFLGKEIKEFCVRNEETIKREDFELVV